MWKITWFTLTPNKNLKRISSSLIENYPTPQFVVIYGDMCVGVLKHLISVTNDQQQRMSGVFRMASFAYMYYNNYLVNDGHI